MRLLRSLVFEALVYLVMAVLGILGMPFALWSVNGAYAVCRLYARVIFVLLRWIATRLGFARKNAIGELAFRETVPEARELEVLAANPPRYLERNTELVLDACAARKVDVLLSTFAWCTSKRDYVAHAGYRRGLDETNASTRAVAARRGAPLYDFKAQMPEDENLWADGRHNSEAGARKKAELFAAAILERFGPALHSKAAASGR